MEIDEEFARYILALQSLAELEQGLDETDLKYRKMIEDNFPKIKEERENKEFEDWLWQEKIEKDPEVIAIRRKQESMFNLKLSYKLDELKAKKHDEYLKNKNALMKEYRLQKAIKKIEK